MEDFSNFIEPIQLPGGEQEFRVKEEVWRRIVTAGGI